MDYEIYEDDIETMDEFMDPKNNDIIYTEDGEELRKLINKRKRENKPISFEEYYKDLTYGGVVDPELSIIDAGILTFGS